MKTLFWALLIATLGTAAAKADEVTITFDQPTQTGTPGQTLQFFGTITNDTNQTIYLNSDSLDADSGVTTTDDFYNTPISLAPSGDPGDSSGDIELFDVTLNQFGSFSGDYTLIGGADGGAGTAQDNLGSASFAVTATPEPASILLVLSAGLAMWPISRRMRREA